MGLWKIVWRDYCQTEITLLRGLTGSCVLGSTLVRLRDCCSAHMSLYNEPASGTSCSSASESGSVHQGFGVSARPKMTWIYLPLHFPWLRGRHLPSTSFRSLLPAKWGALSIRNSAPTSLKAVPGREGCWIGPLRWEFEKCWVLADSASTEVDGETPIDLSVSRIRPTQNTLENPIHME